MGAIENFLATINPSQAAGIARAFGPILQDMAATQKCLAEGLASVRKDTASTARSVGYEFGQGVASLPAFDPRVLPFVQQLKATSGQAAPAYLKRSLGKPATRGSIENVGEFPAWIVLRQERTANNTPERRFYLSAGRVLDITFALDEITAEVVEGEGEIWVQVIAQ